MRNKSILIISVFGKVKEESNDRVNNLYDFSPFESKKIVTTNFSHHNKAKRVGRDIRNVDYIGVPEYNKNLSFKRIWSHWVFAIKLFFYLRDIKLKPDLIYCVLPTPTSGLIAGWYAKKHKITFVTDIIDVWPDGLFPINSTFNRFKWLFLPWELLSAKVYRMSDFICAANRSYASIARKYVKDIPVKHFYLGTSFDNENHQIISNPISKPLDEIWIGYGGNLGHLYDFDLMITGTLAAMQNTSMKVRFILVGGGVLEDELRQKLTKLNVLPYLITGNVGYQEFMQYLEKCDICLNLFKENALISMSYKLYDYFACKSFVMNNLTGDADEIINEFGVGFNVNNDNFAIKLTEAIYALPNFQIEKHEKYEMVYNLLDRKKIIQSIYQFIQK